MKHIVLLNIWPVIESSGGAEKVFCDLANALSSMHFKVTAICCDKKKGRPYFFLSENVNLINIGPQTPFYYRNNLINLLSISPSRRQRHLNRASLSSKIVYEALDPVLKKLNPDIYISFQDQSTYILKNLVGTDKPVITMFHNPPSHYIEKPEFELFKESVERSAAVQVLMKGFIEDAKTRLQHVPIVHIPNCVPQYPEQATLDSHTIICISRFDRQKRLNLLVDAFAKIADNYPSWNLHIWGNPKTNPKDFNTLKDQISKQNLENRVFCKGTTKDIKKEILNASIYVCSSSYEGFSLAMTEAMSLGLPVIGCKDCLSVNELLEGHSVGIVSTPNTIDLSKALSLLIEDSNYRKKLGYNAKKYMKHFSQENIYSQWKNLINKTIKPNNVVIEK